MIGTPLYPKTFRPDWWRFAAFRFLLMFAVYQFGFTLLHAFSSLMGSPLPRQAWIASTISFMVFYSISLFRSKPWLPDHFAICISDGMIEGPTGFKQKRSCFPVKRLDRTRTSEMSWINWLFQARSIWSLDGERIILFNYAFDQEEIKSLLRQIGCEE